MTNMAFAVMHMGLSKSTIARRATMHHLVSDAICSGLTPVAGVDEAGAGALAGPVVAAAVQLLPPSTGLYVADLDDSKKLSRRKREQVFEELTQQSYLEISIATVSAREVDNINVLEARFKAMSAAVAGLNKTMPRMLFVDGNRTLDGIDEGIDQKAIVGGDAQVSVVAAASIIAKVHRDRIMYEQASAFPQYGFEKHMGYATKKHLEALRLHGPCNLHRLSYKPVANSLGALSM